MLYSIQNRVAIVKDFVRSRPFKEKGEIFEENLTEMCDYIPHFYDELRMGFLNCQ